MFGWLWENSLFKRVRFTWRLTLGATCLLLSAGYGVIASTCLSLIGKRSLSQWTVARVFYATFSTLTGIKIDVQNASILETTKPAVLITNHQSELDILVIGRIMPQRGTITAKRSLKFVPILGWFMTLSGTFFIDRRNSTQAISALNRALQKVKSNKEVIYIFPEGTRSYSSSLDMLPFKKGAFHLAVEAGVPIIPCVVSNTSTVFSWKTRTFQPGVITVKVLDPIPTEGLTKDDVNGLVASTQEKMLAALHTLGYSQPAGTSDDKYGLGGVPGESTGLLGAAEDSVESV